MVITDSLWRTRLRSGLTRGTREWCFHLAKELRETGKPGGEGGEGEGRQRVKVRASPAQYFDFLTPPRNKSDLHPLAHFANTGLSFLKQSTYFLIIHFLISELLRNFVH